MQEEHLRFHKDKLASEDSNSVEKTNREKYDAIDRGRATAVLVAKGEILRAGLRQMLLSCHIDVVADGATIPNMLAALPQIVHPTLGLLNTAAGENSEKLFSQLCSARSTWPDTRWLILKSEPEMDFGSSGNIRAAAGVKAILDGDISPRVLALAIEMVLCEHEIFSPGLSRETPTQASSTRTILQSARQPEIAHREVNLSGRENDILQHLIEGAPNKLIARRLNVAEATVKVHVKGLLRKLNASNRTQAAIWGQERRAGSHP